MPNPLLPLIEDEYIRPVAQAATYREALVTKIGPVVEVRFFSDTDSTPLTKPPLVADLAVGDMVMCMILGQSLTIVGKYGGTTPPAPPDNTIVVGGVPYVASGVSGPPPISYVQSYAPVYVARGSIPTPYVPPAGYGFDVYTLNTTGYTWVSVYGQSATSIGLNVLQVGSPTESALSRVGWRLIKL